MPPQTNTICVVPAFFIALPKVQHSSRQRSTCLINNEASQADTWRFHFFFYKIYPFR